MSKTFISLAILIAISQAAFIPLPSQAAYRNPTFANGSPSPPQPANTIGV
jgi:hypothetical protein